MIIRFIRVKSHTGTIEPNMAPFKMTIGTRKVLSSVRPKARMNDPMDYYEKEAKKGELSHTFSIHSTTNFRPSVSPMNSLKS